MNFYFLFSLASSILTFLLGFVVLAKNYKNALNRVFFIFSFSITIWLAGSALLLNNCMDQSLVLLYDRITYFGVIFIPPTLLHLNTLFAKERGQRMLITIAYLISVVFALLSLSEKFIYGLIEYPWGCHTKAGIYHHIFVIYFIIFVIFAFSKLIKAVKSSVGIERSQLKYVLIAFFVLSCGGLGFLPAYGINFPPFVYICGIVSVFIMTYAIIKHRLMDIRFVLRRGSVATSAIISIIAGLVLLKYAQFIVFGEKYALADYLFLIIGILVYPAVNEYFYKLFNKYFFTTLYDAKQVIVELSDKLSTTLHIKHIGQYLIDSISKSLHSENISIFIYNQKKKKYENKFYKGDPTIRPGDFIEDRGFYTNFLKTNQPQLVEEIKHERYIEFKNTIDMLVAKKIEVLIPLILREQTIGIVALGTKGTGDPYNEEDLLLLEILGTQAAIAIDNALHYEEINNFNIKLQKEVERATDDLIRANARLKQLDQAKSEFVSIASHQLRTPLTVIKGYISMILDGSFGPVSPKIHESLDKVYLSNERLIQLVENLLNISRIESGRLQVNKDIKSLDALILGVVEELSVPAKKKGLKLTYHSPSTHLPSVNIDEEKIRQVVLNLIDNAIKYTSQGEIKVTLEQVGDELKCSIKDNGMGIKPEDLPEIFDKFTRGSGTALVHTEGTGLGLYVAKQMIMVHGGKIWAESAGEGKGSTFIFTLPVAKLNDEKDQK